MECLRGTWGSLWREQGYSPCDGVRALAMLWVCWFHAVSIFVNTSGNLGKRVASEWWPVAVPMSGDLGVELFLVLSGFLLGGNLFRQIAGEAGKLAWGKFYVQRWFRIAPALASSLVVSSILNAPSGSHWGCRHYWWAHMLFVNNYYPFWESFPQPGHKHLPMCMIHTWSVAVEFQLYCLTPPLLVVAVRLSSSIVGLTKARAVLALCAFAWVACLVVRLFNVGHYGTFRPPYPDTALRMAPYVCGVAAGVFVHEDERHRTAQGPKIAPTPFRFQLLGVWLSGVVLAFGALVGGGEPGYLVDNAEFGHWYVHAHHKLALLHAALL
eukprot:CAMPEP_0180507532 /NCGR_PEP_ID=MMETSP1036_2-20121128/48654_1 /TAXON_ID=632150 /ORGANISM="Azadinium spinosum, Strain 3D9" /LENGTH=324 /DNA_ID=CAMNT_0022517709 /DNA_START=27 /DNA_END=998 /DNA_ORIENTATION=-